MEQIVSRCVRGLWILSFSAPIGYSVKGLAKGSAAPKNAHISESANPIETEVYHCNDGDTCRVKVAGAVWLNVRLAGIDAPEVAKKRGKKPGQPFSEEAKAFLNQQLRNKKVMLRQVDLDHYNRPIVEIYLGEKNINLELLKLGLAEVYRGKVKRVDRQQFESAEAEARQSKKGIWSRDHVSPKVFRQKN